MRTALLFFFLIGVIAPIAVWLLTKRYPDSWLNYVKWVTASSCLVSLLTFETLSPSFPSVRSPVPDLRSLCSLAHSISPIRLMFTGIGLIPPATAVNYVPWALMGFIFQCLLRRRYFPLWAKYNCKSASLLSLSRSICTSSSGFVRVAQCPYNVAPSDVLSAALDAGTAIGTLLVYFWYVNMPVGAHS